jgi:hypothetical protein
MSKTYDIDIYHIFPEHMSSFLCDAAPKMWFTKDIAVRIPPSVWLILVEENPYALAGSPIFANANFILSI